MFFYTVHVFRTRQCDVVEYSFKANIYGVHNRSLCIPLISISETDLSIMSITIQMLYLTSALLCWTWHANKIYLKFHLGPQYEKSVQNRPKTGLSKTDFPFCATYTEKLCTNFKWNWFRYAICIVRVHIFYKYLLFC